MKVQNNRAWLLTLPALSLLGLLGLVPLVTVVNFSFFDIFTLEKRYWVGWEWYVELVGSSETYKSLFRSILFTSLVLFFQFPIGIGLALLLPKNRVLSGFLLMVFTIPLVIPWNMIPIIWLNLLHPNFGFLVGILEAVGIDFDYKFNPVHTYVLLVVVDTWHWLGLVVILAYSGVSSIHPAYYQAAKIDGASRWSIFRNIELPKMQGVLLMALLLRTLDSLMIYTEAFAINAGGPQKATSFLSLELGEEIAAFNYGPAAARSVLYFLFVLTVVWLFRIRMQREARN